MSDFVNVSEDGGVSKRIIRQGTGNIPPVGSKVYVHYVATLDDAHGRTELDSSRRSQRTPLQFCLGHDEVIRGFEAAVGSMRAGEQAEVRCEPRYAYGADGSPPHVPPAATLLFDLELISWDKPVPETIEEQLEAAHELKQRGNERFAAGQHAAAAGCYQQATRLFDGTARTADSSERRLIEATRLACLPNLAACHLKLDDAASAMRDAAKALEIDSANVKALFRLGSAQALAGETATAKATLTKAANAAPASAEIRQALQAVLEQDKLHEAKQRQMFGGKLVSK
eukprot:TRINITY_DN2369_c0_g1_i1.p2 TRINITY_DN2369_c0_g1~~TRINITY_DN2369_c0_g1_i1.p2  ORF type:complete len:285 (-),score=117.56 TRINITY_DN2369_c0_g1_i1:282-1136(-)